MAVFRIEKTKDYTIMSNFHLRDRELSLKAKGLISLMLSLPEDWDYTLAGLSYICQDGVSSVRSGVAELEKHGYLVRRRIREVNGQLGDIEYTILERPLENAEHLVTPTDTPEPICDEPMLEKPTCEKPTLVFPAYENHPQLNTDQSNTKKSNTHESNIHPSIRSAVGDPMDAMETYRAILKENIGYDALSERNKSSPDEVDEILELMLEVVCTTRKAIRIGGEDKPAELVKSRMLAINQFHAEYVLDSLRENTTEIRNIKSYLLTALYNAPSTIGSYYRARVNHDFCGSQ